MSVSGTLSTTLSVSAPQRKMLTHYSNDNGQITKRLVSIRNIDILTINVGAITAQDYVHIRSLTLRLLMSYIYIYIWSS